MEDDKGLVWNMTSCIFHKKPFPSILINKENSIPMTEEEKSKATIEIREFIPDFDYDTEYQKTRNKKYLLELYNSAESGFEKLQIFRIIKPSNSDNKIIKKFVNESYHVGNDYIWQLNPREFDTVPQFVIDECDKEIALLTV